MGAFYIGCKVENRGESRQIAPGIVNDERHGRTPDLKPLPGEMSPAVV
jgi:hypothetical protein